MNTFRSLLQRFFPPYQPISAGVYQYATPPEAEYAYRLHLRIEADGRGLLIVNGSTVVHLNQTAAEYCYHFIQNSATEAVAAQVARRYGIKETQALDDFTGLADRLNNLIAVPDLDPVTYLDFERDEPYSGAISAPYRLDCALTYRLPDAGFERYVPIDRVKEELPQESWQVILKKAWDAGIPHAVFTGGEPTLRPDMIDLIKFASQLGMVTGLISNGLRLAERDYLHQLLQSGVDHLMLILDPDDEASWEALRDTLAEDLAVTVHLTMTKRDFENIEGLLERLGKMGVASVSVSASTTNLAHIVPEAAQAIAEHNLRLVWDLPVPYSRLNPISLELAQVQEEPPQGAGKAWVYVEPDGDVLPAQGVNDVLGNLLKDTWENIWTRPEPA